MQCHDCRDSVVVAFLLAISIIFSAFKTPWLATRSTTNTTSALNSLHWLPIQQRINFKLLSCPPFTPQPGPQYLSYLLHPCTPSRLLRSVSLNLISQPRINITLASHGFQHAGPSLWNSLPHHLRSTDSYNVFKSNLKLTFSLVQASLAPSNFYPRATDLTCSSKV